MDSVKLVEEFHLAFGHLINDRPQLPDHKNHEFRVKFIKEELDEATQAHYDNDIVELADALGDIQYVLDGWFLNAGLQDYKEAIMAEIHRSNMSKLCTSEEHAKETMQHLIEQEGESYLEIDRKPMGDYWVVYKIDTGKILKAKGYSKPDLKKVLFNPQW